MEKAVPTEGQSASEEGVWHAMAAQAVIECLAADRHQGLSEDEALSRFKRFGPNQIAPPKQRPWWLRVLLQFHNVLIYVMLAAAAVTSFLGHWIDTGVLLAAVFINAIIGFVQEGKAEEALDAIRAMLSSHASVVRGGVLKTVSVEQIVPGDIVLLASGDKVPADIRLISAKNPRVNEAILTGESDIVEKDAAPVCADALLGDRKSMLYSGTLVASGQVTGVVVATGPNTELGRIGTMLERVQEVTTPLLRQIAHFSRWLALTIVLMSAMTFIIGVTWRGHAPADMFVMVVALAAAAIPEGLPAIMTITLAMGVRRMANQHAIVRHLPAVEALGSVTIICTDKTGTLTRNEMAVQRILTSDLVFEVSGVGYAPSGALHVGGVAASPEDHPALAAITRATVLCNDAQLHRQDGEWRMQGDPTEGALLTLALKVGVDPVCERVSWHRTDVIPFESEHRLMATLHHGNGGNGIIYVKGAPERIIGMCDRQGGEQPLDFDYWRRGAVDFAARGLRVLAVAEKMVGPEQREVHFPDLEHGFCLLALVGIIDPPREEAVAAVADCTAAGIQVKMITGDHAETARAIGARMGIGRGRPALTGSEIELMDNQQLRQVVSSIDVFARSSPEHKLRLVEAMQANGQIVAMTGDGVNDAPALKRADIGVAMGMKGTEAAKEAADMVLADDNFATISKAVREGRGIYDNIQKFVLFMLPTNGGEGLVVVAAILFELLLPLTAAQVLWINMVTSSTLGLALAFEPPEHDVMRRQPRDPREPLLSWFFVWRVLMVSLLMMAGALGLFLWELDKGASVETARTMAVSAVVVAEMFYLLNSRYTYRSVLSFEGLFGNPYVLYAIGACAVLQFAFVYAPPLQRVLGSAPLGIGEWLHVVMAGGLLFVVAEIEKMIVSRLMKKTAPAAAGQWRNEQQASSIQG